MVKKFDCWKKETDILSREVQNRLDKAVTHKQSLLDSLHEETAKQQKVSSEISECNELLQQMEETLGKHLKSESSLRLEIDDVKKEEGELLSTTATTVLQLEADTQSIIMKSREMRESLPKLEESIVKQEKDLETARKNHLDLCTANEVPVTSNDNGPTSWDDNASNVLLEVEEKAIKEEQDAIDALKLEYDELQTTLRSLQKEEEELTIQASQQQQAEKDIREREVLREEEFNKQLEQLESDRAGTKSIVAKVEEVRVLQETQKADNSATAMKLADDIATLEAENTAAENANLDLDKQIQDLEEQIELSLADKKRRSAELESTIALEEELTAKTKNEADAIEQREREAEDYGVIESEISRIIGGTSEIIQCCNVSLSISHHCDFSERLPHSAVRRCNLRP